MKKTLLSVLLIFAFCAASFSQETEADSGKKNKYEVSPEVYADHASRVPEFQEILDSQRHFGLVYNWGLAMGSVTRIVKQTSRSNFVWNDSLMGAYFELQSHDLMTFNDFMNLNFMGRTAIYYPYHYTFNKHPQEAKTPILYAFDFFTAPVLTFSVFDVVRFNVEPGLHWAYQLSDKWHLWSLGPGIKLDAELPVSSSWNVLLGWMFTWDNGNLGSNKRMQPYDVVYEYQWQLGARYSPNCRNRFSYIKYREPKSQRKKEKLVMKTWPEQKARIKQERKEAREAKKAAGEASKKASVTALEMEETK